jgi:hypothetical protein
VWSVRRPPVQGHAQDLADAIDLDILSEHAGSPTPCHRDDQAVQEAARGHHDATTATTATLDTGSHIEICSRINRQQMRSQQQPAEILRTSVIACASKYLHEHGLGDDERAVGGDQLRHPPIHAAARRPIELHAGRGVGEDHAAPRGAPSSGTSPHGSRAAHGQRLIAAHRLTGQVPQREVIPERPGIVIAEAELAPRCPAAGDVHSVPRPG